jgi:hypothetical protein
LWIAHNFAKLYAPLTAGILQPFPADQPLPKGKITALDFRYTAVIQPMLSASKPPKKLIPFLVGLFDWSF